MIENIPKIEPSDEKFRILFELSPLGMAMIEHKTGKFLEVNQSLLNSLNYSKEEFLSLSFYDITPNEYEEQEKQQIKDLEKQLWDSADNLRANSKLTAAEYKDPVLGLILLRFAQNRFEEAKYRLKIIFQ